MRRCCSAWGRSHHVCHEVTPRLVGPLIHRSQFGKGLKKQHKRTSSVQSCAEQCKQSIAGPRDDHARDARWPKSGLSNLLLDSIDDPDGGRGVHVQDDPLPCQRPDEEVHSALSTTLSEPCVVSPPAHRRRALPPSSSRSVQVRHDVADGLHELSSKPWSDSPHTWSEPRATWPRFCQLPE